MILISGLLCSRSAYYTKVRLLQLYIVKNVNLDLFLRRNYNLKGWCLIQHSICHDHQVKSNRLKLRQMRSSTRQIDPPNQAFS
jgi:hypothetical protein